MSTYSNLKRKFPTWFFTLPKPTVKVDWSGNWTHAFGTRVRRSTYRVIGTTEIGGEIYQFSVHEIYSWRYVWRWQKCVMQYVYFDFWRSHFASEITEILKGNGNIIFYFLIWNYILIFWNYMLTSLPIFHILLSSWNIFTWVMRCPPSWINFWSHWQ